MISSLNERDNGNVENISKIIFKDKPLLLKIT